MRSAFLDDAEPEAVSHAVRDVLEKRGALISEHRHSRIKFHSLRPRPMTWPRAGYVGIYQHLGERETELRFLLRARIPWRILWTVCVVNVLFLAFAIAVDPAPTTWTMLAIVGGLALVVATVLYVGTWKSVRAEERDIMEEFERAIGAIPDVDVVRAEERELAELEAQLEGEITRRRLEAARPPKEKREKGSRFRLGPRKKDDPPAAGDTGAASEGETEDERRARLLARKAELEARLRERREAEAASPPREE